MDRAPRLSLRERWSAAADLIRDHRDLLDQRVWGGTPTPAVSSRGWGCALLALDDDALASLEVEGAAARWPDGLPASLTALVDRVRRIVEVDAVASDEGPRRARRRGETDRKRAQVDALASAARELIAGAARVVDVGSGHGHLSRELSERFGRPVVGLERSPAFVAKARALGQASRAEDRTDFEVRDVLVHGLDVHAGDCAVGLHACGELGDAIVKRAAAVGASVALVGCCLQKQRADVRAPLVQGGDDAPSLPKTLLGLSNLTARDRGVEASREVNLAARERRLVLHRLLADVGGDPRVGSEIEGLNRRAARGDVAQLVARAFAVRGIPAPDASVVASAVEATRLDYARARRLALPRALFGRVLEVFVLADRALFLEERGFDVRIGALFPPDVSARNLALVARPR